MRRIRIRHHKKVGRTRQWRMRVSKAGKLRGTCPIGHDPHVFDFLAEKDQGVRDACCGNYGRPLPIVVEHRETVKL